MFDLRTYFVKERVGMLKFHDVYDILSPETGEKIGLAKEEVGGFTQLLRLMVNKRFLPTKVVIYEGEEASPDAALLTIKRGSTFLRPTIQVLDHDGELIGTLKSKLMSIGGAFKVYSANGEEIAQVKGDWKGWNFRFLVGDQEIGKVTKKWAGFGKELFTSADNYVITMQDDVSEDEAKMLLAAGIAIDTVLKET